MSLDTQEQRVASITGPQKKLNGAGSLGWIVDNARDLIILLDKEGNVEYVNEAIKTIAGLLPEKVQGKQIFDLFEKHHQRDELIEYFHRIIANPSEAHLIEIECLQQGKIIGYLESQGKCHYNDAGEKEVVVFCRDITKRKQAENELDRSKTLFQSAFDFAPIGIAIVGLTGEFHEINDAFCKILGYSKDEMLQLSFKEITYHQDLEESANYLKEMSAGHIDSFKLEKRYVHQSGRIIWARLSVSLVRDKNGQPQYFVSQVEDITENQHVDAALRDSEIKYRTLFENVLEAVYQVTDDGKLLTANPAMAAMLGYDSVEELLSIKRSHELYLNPDDRTDWTRKIKHEGVLINVEVTLKKKDGTHVHVLDNARAVRDDEGKLLYYEGTLTDITQYKKATQALKDNRANLRALIENTQDSIWSIDQNYRVMAINSTFKAAFQLAYGKKLQPGVNILEMVDTHTRQFWKDNYDRVFKGERFSINQHYQYSGITKDVEINFNPIISENGQITGVAVFAHDVTERKKAVEALRQSEERYRLLVENAQIGIFSTNTEGKIQDANPKLVEILGLPSLAAVRAFNILTAAPFVANSISDDVRRCFIEGKTVSGEREYINAKGKELHLYYNFSPVKNQEGEVIRMQALVQDISERRKVTDQLFEFYKYLGIINRKLAILLDFGKEQSNKTQNEALDFLLNSAKEISNAKIVMFYRYNQSFDKIKLLSSIGLPNSEQYGSEIAVDKCDFIAKIISEQSRAQTHQNCTCPLDQISQEIELKSLLGIPLVYSNKIYGILVFGFDNQKELTTQELDFYEVFALQATNALVNNVL